MTDKSPNAYYVMSFQDVRDFDGTRAVTRTQRTLVAQDDRYDVAEAFDTRAAAEAWIAAEKAANRPTRHSTSRRRSTRSAPSRRFRSGSTACSSRRTSMPEPLPPRPNQLRSRTTGAGPVASESPDKPDRRSQGNHDMTNDAQLLGALAAAQAEHAAATDSLNGFMKRAKLLGGCRTRALREERANLQARVDAPKAALEAAEEVAPEVGPLDALAVSHPDLVHQVRSAKAAWRAAQEACVGLWKRPAELRVANRTLRSARGTMWAWQERLEAAEEDRVLDAADADAARILAMPRDQVLADMQSEARSPRTALADARMRLAVAVQGGVDADVAACRQLVSDAEAGMHAAIDEARRNLDDALVAFQSLTCGNLLGRQDAGHGIQADTGSIEGDIDSNAAMLPDDTREAWRALLARNRSTTAPETRY